MKSDTSAAQISFSTETHARAKTNQMKTPIQYRKEYRAISGVHYIFLGTPYYAIEPKTAEGRWMIFSHNPDTTFHRLANYFDEVVQYVEQAQRP